jgi:folate-binding protein YgfZ
VITVEPELQAAVETAVILTTARPGRVLLHGKDCLDLLQRLSTNDLSPVLRKQAVPTVLATAKGRITDLVVVVQTEGELLLLTSPGAEMDVSRWIEAYTITEDSTPDAVTERTGLVTIHGPHAHSIVSAFSSHRDESQSGVLVIPVHWRNRMEAHLYGSLPAIEAALERARSFGLSTLDANATEHLRIMTGTPSRPAELNDQHTPYDVGLEEALCFTKGCYIGQEVIARIDTYDKARRSLVIFESHGQKTIPGTMITNSRGTIVGKATSVSPCSRGGIHTGLAVVERRWLDMVGEQVFAGGKEVYMRLPITSGRI